MSLTDAEILYAALQVLQANTVDRCLPFFPLYRSTKRLAKQLGWTIRRVAKAIESNRKNEILIANYGGGYFIPETRGHMECTLELYKGRALTALYTLRRMQVATNSTFPLKDTANQRDFFKEAINEI